MSTETGGPGPADVRPAADPTGSDRPSPPPAHPVSDVHRRGGATFWLTALIGWAVIGYGLYGLFHHHIDTRPTNLAKFVVAGALLHDLVFAPIVLVLGVVVTRIVGERARAIVQGALIVSGCLALFSYPLVRDYASAVHNPTSLPHNYTVNLALVLAVVWAIATMALLMRLRRTRRHPA